MIIIKDRPTVTAVEAKAILDRHTASGGVLIDLDRALDYRTYFNREKKRRADKLAKKTGRIDYDVKGATLIQDFKTFFPDQAVYFRTNLNDPYSNTSAEAKHLEKRIKAGCFSQEAVIHIREYQEALSVKTAYQNILKYINLPLLSMESFEGHRMVLARPEWRILNTGRLGTAEPNIQSLAKTQSDLITYPKGWILLRYDSGQIEPRITYSVFIKDPVIKDLIIMYDDAYYGQLFFALMDAEELRSIRRGDRKLVKQEITPEIEKLRGDLKKMSLIGNYDGDLSQFDPKLAKAYQDRIVNNPYRLKMLKEIKEKVAAGQSVFHSFFGTPIIPKETSKYTPGTPGWDAHVERCGLNNPIQATAADLMCQSVYEQDRLLSEKASDLSWIGYYKHDEGCTYLHEKDKHLQEEIAGLTAYQVRDWIPIGCDLDIGIKEPKEPFDYKIKRPEIA